MSKRHWLRDEIDFGPLNNSRPHYGICDECEVGDDCYNCNAAAQEIADSLALDGCIVTDEYSSADSRLKNLDGHARVTCGYFA